jgi:hypothetical protein
VSLREDKARIKARTAERERDISQFLQELEKIFGTSILSTLKRLRALKPDAIVAAGVINDIERVLDENGFAEVFAAQTVLYQKELKGIRETFAAIGAPPAGRISGIDAPIIETLASFNSRKVANTLENLVADSKSLIYRSYILGESVDISDIQEQFGDLAFSHVKTELNTAMADFSRTVSAKKAKDAGMDLFLYVGPDDEVTRDFCAELLSKDPPIYREDEIGANDQGGDAMTEGGGYNCRHQWVAVTEEYARELGYDG